MLNNQFLSIIDNHSYIDWQDTFTEYCISKQFDSELCGFTVYRRMGVLFLTLFVYDHFALKATEIYVQFWIYICPHIYNLQFTLDIMNFL